MFFFSLPAGHFHLCAGLFISYVCHFKCAPCHWICESMAVLITTFNRHPALSLQNTVIGGMTIDGDLLSLHPTSKRAKSVHWYIYSYTSTTHKIRKMKSEDVGVVECHRGGTVSSRPTRLRATQVRKHEKDIRIVLKLLIQGHWHAPFVFFFYFRLELIVRFCAHANRRRAAHFIRIKVPSLLFCG